MKHEKLDIQGTVTDFEPGHQNREQEPVTHRVAWFYPLFRDGDKTCSAIELDIMHVRCVEQIRITYDSNRNGFVIEQPTVDTWEADDPDSGNPHWQEVAFVGGNGLIADKEDTENGR